MRLFRKAPSIEIEAADLEPIPLLDGINTGIAKTLDELRALAMTLDAEIADRQQRRGDVDVAIASFEAAQQIALNRGRVDKPLLADTDKIGRLVPRTVKGGRS